MRRGRKGDGLPRIVTNGRHLKDISAEALAALQRRNDPPTVFVRGGQLVRLRSGDCGQPMIETIDEAILKHLLERAANFVKQREGGASPVSPPYQVVRDVLAMDRWDFPTLVHTVEVPILRRDGSIHDRNGYDAKTHLYYWQRKGLTVPPIPSSPTATQVKDAVDLLQEVVIDFPFDCVASRANALAAIATPIVRPMIDGPVPLAIIDAPQQGTGKGLLAGVVAALATGREAAIITAPTTSEEWRKVVTSILNAGVTLILIDNIEGRLNSHVLAAVLTSRVWRDRILGQTQIIEIPQEATWIGNGNNLKLGGDLQRRCYRIRLDAQMSQPWTKAGFKHPQLLAWVHQNRGRLVAAVLVIARGWSAAGGHTPEKSPGIGSFQEWCRVLGGMLSFAGIPGFLGNLTEMYESADDEAAEWEAFLIQTLRWSTAAFTAAELAKAMESDEQLRNALPDELDDAWKRRHSGGTFSKTLGRALARRQDRRHGIGQCRIEGAGTVQNAKLWRVGGTPPALAA